LFSMKECPGRVALVTGASKGGTGTAVAIRLAAEGAKVALTARSEEGLEATKARIHEVGGEALLLPCDLADPHGGRGTLIKRTEDHLGPIDILVNNAAANGYHPFDETTAKALEHCLQVNLWAPWELMAQAVASMRRRGAGWIVNMTSFAAELPPGPPFPRNLPAKSGFQYGASKAALNRLTVAAASECEGDGISINALSPQAAIATPSLVAGGWIDEVMFEPLETMAEASVALCSIREPPITGRIAYSLQLLLELRRPVRDLIGESLVDGWQPPDLPAIIQRQEAQLASQGWVDAYQFGRIHSPTSHRSLT
jgi:citronellol/citronellal dehydrogenase